MIPEAGVGIYQQDPTQGPACAIACGAGTIYRNHFALVHGRTGQTALCRIDCLADLGEALDNGDHEFWPMRNGYALPTGDGLKIVSGLPFVQDESDRDELRELLRVGIQAGAEVTLQDAGRTVVQVYCSALPVAYPSRAPGQWENFARLVLEAAYQATFLVALLDLAETGNPHLYQTWLGGGAFGNGDGWIRDAVRRAIDSCAGRPRGVDRELRPLPPRGAGIAHRMSGRRGTGRSSADSCGGKGTPPLTPKRIPCFLNTSLRNSGA